MPVFVVILDRIFPAFSCIRSEYGEIRSLNAGKCGKNADQNNGEYGHFLHSVIYTLSQFKGHILCDLIVMYNVV